MPSPEKNFHHRQSVALYRRIAVSFIVFTLILIVVVIYLSFSEAVIVVYPKEDVVTTNFIVTTKSLSGKVFEENFTRSLTYQSTGEKVVESDILGTVTLFNNYSIKQPLVATTRLLTPDGQLFRLKNTVAVPPHGTVKNVAIYADDPATLKLPIPEKERFTIPGLYSGLQDKIYAETDTALESASRKVRVINSDDIKKAEEQLERILVEDAKKKFESLLIAEGTSLKIELTKLEVLAVTTDGKVDEERDEFEVTMNARVVGIAFDRATLEALAKEKLIEKLVDDTELDLMDVGNFTFQLANYDAKVKEAELQIYLEGKTQLRLTSPILSKQNFTGKTKKEVVALLTEFSVIQDVEVNLSPFWLTRIPKLLDHIDIVIKQIEK